MTLNRLTLCVKRILVQTLSLLIRCRYIWLISPTSCQLGPAAISPWWSRQSVQITSDWCRIPKVEWRMGWKSKVILQTEPTKSNSVQMNQGQQYKVRSRKNFTLSCPRASGEMLVKIQEVSYSSQRYWHLSCCPLYSFWQQFFENTQMYTEVQGEKWCIAKGWGYWVVSEQKIPSAGMASLKCETTCFCFLLKMVVINCLHLAVG